MNDLNISYQDKVITPYHSAKEVMLSLKNKFEMHKIVSVDTISSVTLETIKMAPIKITPKTEIYSIEKNERSKIFYKYFHNRFAFQPLLCIIYDKHSEKICSNNCELLDIYITILHGIDHKDIEENSGKFKSYLNSIYLYDTYQK